MYEAPVSTSADVDVVFAYDVREKRIERDYDQVPLFDRPTADNPFVTSYTERRKKIEIVYEKELRVIATEKHPAPNTPARVWDISIISEEKDPSLAKAMPRLAAAGCDRIGTNTDGPVIVRLREKDEVVSFIKQGP